MVDATRADSSDSIAASAATATAGPTSAARVAVYRPSREGAGRATGSAATGSTGRPASAARNDAMTMASSDPGKRGCSLRDTSITVTTIATSSSDQPSFGHDATARDWAAATRALVLSPGSVPVAVGT